MARRYTVFFFLFLSSHFAKAQNWPIIPTQEEMDYQLQHPEEFTCNTANKTTATSEMPNDARFPGEYEESEAVAVGWPYSGFSTLDTSSSTSKLWAQLADAIQQECPVWIRLKAAADTGKLKLFMSNRGTPLVQYRFFFYNSNAYWMRDFGPIGFYYSNDDSVGFLDMHYYNSRPLDDMFPSQLASEFGYLNVSTQLYAEGGNYMTDGYKHIYHSSKIGTVNAGSTHSPSWTVQQGNDSVKYYWAADSVIVTPGLSCDGGTQHIDMYLKLVDEQTFAIMEYPPVVTAVDKAKIDTVIALVSQKTSTYNKPYRVFKLPMPTKNDGTYNTTCNQIDADARTFVNGLLVNKTYVMPVFSSSSSGNQAGDTAAIEIFKKILPGYNIIPIDARILTTQGGAIHCVTMQIPSGNPLRIWHPMVVDMQPWSAATHIIARMTNKSGIASAQGKWRIKGTTSWTNINLADSLGGVYKTGNISGYTVNDTVEYYITGSSNNGKSAAKPITAPTGFYTFYFDKSTGAHIPDPDQNFALNPLPNPSTGVFYIPVSFSNTMQVQAIITDVMGRKISTVDFGKRNAGMSKLDFDLAGEASGMYFVQVKANGWLIDTKKICKL